MPDSHDLDPLRSLFREAASAGQTGSGLPPVSVIARRGERVRRRRIAGIAVACFLVLAGSGTALASLLPADPAPALPATTPSPAPPSPVPTGPLGTSTEPGPPRSTTSSGGSATATTAPTATSTTQPLP
ncbi:hypothetical protein ACGFYU_06970 [Streptomyces sp. NPDC048337]|uniref:hypothetical protein n=1 Tax=Streptomyces sp. NPDC048337 TaxID=3365535 RepID=UPI0037144535